MKSRQKIQTGEWPVVVLNATGKQGGAVAAGLLRNPQSANARSLAANGDQRVSGGLHDPDIIRAAMAGAAGVFSVQPNSGSATSSITDEEAVRFGKSVVDSAIAVDASGLRIGKHQQLRPGRARQLELQAGH